MGISIRQLAATFAGEVTDVDCRRPLSPDQVVAIHAGMAEYAVLVFRDQPLTDGEQLCFTLHFGELEETRGGTPGNIHFRTDREVRKLGPGIKDSPGTRHYGTFRSACISMSRSTTPLCSAVVD